MGRGSDMHERTPVGPLNTVQKSLLLPKSEALTPAHLLSFLGAASSVAVFFIAYGSLLMLRNALVRIGAFLVLSIAPTTDRTVPCSISFLPLVAFSFSDQMHQDWRLPPS